MRGMMLQDWVTVRGQVATTTPIVQGQPFWLDLLQYRDVIAWLEVREASNDRGTVQLTYQTAPTQDEALFAPMVAAFDVGVGVTVTQMIAPIIVGVPLARYLRWSMAPSAPSAAAPWDVTFRILVAVNQPGSARSAVRAFDASKPNLGAMNKGLAVPMKTSSPNAPGGAINSGAGGPTAGGRPRVSLGADYRISQKP
jgi:hypothetical protein